MQVIKQKLLALAETPSDINEHLFTIKGYAEGCAHITELGVREVVSTWALLSAMPNKLVCIDINECEIGEISKAASDVGVEFQFIKDNTVRDGFSIEETDFLFIDTWHVYPQLKKELDIHGKNVRKYIALHDTHTYGWVNEDGFISNPSGLKPAIIEFMENNPQWVLCNHYGNNNGLTILRRM